MLLRRTGRLLWPETETAKMPMLSNIPHLKTPCLGGGCTYSKLIICTTGGVGPGCPPYAESSQGMK